MEMHYIQRGDTPIRGFRKVSDPNLPGIEVLQRCKINSKTCKRRQIHEVRLVVTIVLTIIDEVIGCTQRSIHIDWQWFGNGLALIGGGDIPGF